MDGMLDLALAERNAGPACDAGNRIPTARYPVYATSLSQSVPDTAPSHTFVFEAERDTLFTDLSVQVFNDANGALLQNGTVSVTYCNVTYLLNSSTNVWQPCCQRKPLFLVGVRENKKMAITVNAAGVPAAGSATITVSLSGFQGSGCCG